MIESTSEPKFRDNFIVWVWEGRVPIAKRGVPDPLCRTVIRPRGIRAALRVLFGRAEWAVNVQPISAAVGSAVMGVLNVEPKTSTTLFGRPHAIGCTCNRNNVDDDEHAPTCGLNAG